MFNTKIVQKQQQQQQLIADTYANLGEKNNNKKKRNSFFTGEFSNQHYSYKIRSETGLVWNWISRMQFTGDFAFPLSTGPGLAGNISRQSQANRKSRNVPRDGCRLVTR